MAGFIPTGKRQDWCTPESILGPVRAFFGGQIDLDPCGNEQSTVGARVTYMPPVDGLLYPWDARTVFVNPPYGKAHGEQRFLDKCARHAERYDTETIALVFVKSDTPAWQRSVFGAASAICFIRGRVKFNGASQGAPQPSALIYWGTKHHEFKELFRHLGAIVLNP